MQTVVGQLPFLTQLAQAAEGIEVGAVVAGVDRGDDLPRPPAAPPRRRPCRRRRPGAARAPCDPSAVRARARPAAAAISWARASAARSSAAPRQCRAWIGPLSSTPQADALEPSAVELGEELGRLLLATVERGVEARLLVARQQQLEAVVAGVGDALDADQAARLERPAAGDAADQAEALAQRRQQLRCLRGGTAACSGRSTIGARVPSTSVRIAVRAGSARSAASSASRSPVSALAGTRLVSRHDGH